MAIGEHTPNPPENYYAWKSGHMIHLSTGALIVNEQGLILVIHLERTDAKYFLPTKTHKPETTLEQTLAEISKRTGWEVEIEDFLGTTIGKFPTPEGNVTKSVIWYKCKPVKEVARDAEDRDADATIEWKTREELTEIFAGQSHISSDVDQRRALELLNRENF